MNGDRQGKGVARERGKVLVLVVVKEGKGAAAVEMRGANLVPFDSHLTSGCGMLV